MSTSFCSLPLLHMILTTLNAVNGHCRCLKSGMPGPPIPPLGSHKFNPNGTWEKILKPAPFNTNLPGPTEQGKGSFSAFFFFGRGEEGLEMAWTNGWCFFPQVIPGRHHELFVDCPEKAFHVEPVAVQLGYPGKMWYTSQEWPPKKTQEQHH